MKKEFVSRKQNTPACYACYRPCAEKEDYYCKVCIGSGAATRHAEMVARWRAEVEAKSA